MWLIHTKESGHLKKLLFVIALCIGSSAYAGPPKCFLHGVITPTGDNKEKTSLSDMIRMHFDAAEKAKCEQMMTAYCTYNVKDKKYSPERLQGVFKADVDKSDESRYTFNYKCKLNIEEN
ncbi:MAG: hypothetical protein M9962_09410 [Oligoflexia bacterium]|nr:hypothetical protein [Oligoflexia bacterium]